MMKKQLLLLSLYIASFSISEAQVPYFQHYYPIRKSEPVRTYTIFQDQTGFMWMGTDHGLFKFDGLAFRQYSKADSLPDDHVTAIAQDSIGRIWMGHQNGRLSFLNNHGKVIPFNPDEGSSTAQVSSILFDRKGNLWFSTLNDGLYYYRKKRLYRLDESDGMPDIYVYDLAEDADGRILAGTDGGLVLCGLTDKNVVIDVIDYDDGLPDNIIRKIFIDEREYAWLATQDAGLVTVDLKNKKVSPVTEKEWTHGAIYDFVIKDNKVWMSTSTGGLLIYNFITGKTAVNTTREESGSQTFQDLLKDKEGNIWMGSKSEVMRTHGDEVQFIEQFGSVHDTNILAIAIDTDNAIWFSNKEGLYKRTVDENGNVTMYEPLSGTAFHRYTVINLFVDVNGYLWAGLYGEGVIRIDTRTGIIKHLRKELRNGNVLSITGDDQYVWLATLGGSTRIDISKKELEIENFSQEDGLVSDFIYQVFIDSHKRVWFATDGRGAVMMDESGFHHFEQVRGTNVVFGFAEDTNGDVWANIQNDNLYHYDGNKFSPIDSGFQMRSDNILGLTSDSHGNLLLFHDRGIDVYDVLNKRVRYFGEEVGVKEKIPNLNAISHDRDNNIFVGTNEGIVKFASAQAEGNKNPIPTIVGIRVGDMEINNRKNILLRHNQNYVSITYLGIWYRNPTGVNYAYMLENYDQDWRMSQDQEVTYSNLPPGTYTFILKAFNIEGIDDAKETSVKIVIQAPFWRTSGFYFLCAGFFILIGFLFIKYREKRLVAEKEKLEQKVLERTREIQKQAEEIQSQAEEISSMNENLERLVLERTSELERKNVALEEYAFINAHKLRSPLASILGLVNLLRKVDLKDDEKEILDRLNGASEKLENIVRDITIAIQKGDHKRNL